MFDVKIRKTIMGKKGVLLVNLGTPDDPSRGAVYRYLKQFLLDKRVIDVNAVLRNILVRGIIAPFRSGSSAKLYKELWTEEGSPIKVYGYKLKEGVQELLGDEYVVELAMRYQSPALEPAIMKLLKEDKVDDIVVLPLFPHYASASTGSVQEEVMRIIGKQFTIPTIKFINSFPDNPGMIEVFSENAAKLGVENYEHVLFSFHGLPARQLVKSDISQSHCQKSKDCCQTICEDNKFCYSAQCHLTARKIAEKLNINEKDYTVCFQSRLGRDPWVQPYTTDILKERSEQGIKSLLVFSPAFVADCLETTVEISMEYHEEWEEMGGEKLDLVPSLNDHPTWVKSVADMVR